MLIDIHMLKSFPPTNLNRDEGGSPKTCFFGGTQRGRLSSQSLKRPWRTSEYFADLPMGIRTQHLPKLVGEALRAEGVEDAYIDIAMELVAKMGKGDKGQGESEQEEDAGGGKPTSTAQIMFFSHADIQAVADIVKASIDEAGSPKAFKKAKPADWSKALKEQKRGVSLDMALVGRMITDAAFRDVEASMQVAHAISTHTVAMESDFFTAVDDLKQYRADAGSAMMGDVDFNACCYYFYISLDVDQLRRNVDSSPDVQAILSRVLPLFLEAIAYTNPSGKQNTFAGHSTPGLIMVERKERNIPVSYVNAFEIPVRGDRRTGLMRPSVEALSRFVDTFDESFALPIAQRLWFCPAEESVMPANASRVKTLMDLCGRVSDWI